jgi:threonine dehydrogenase-like Zn-dependent dehydrogenase
LVRDLGASYHSDTIDDLMKSLRPDVVVEATGVGSLVFSAMSGTAPFGIVCLTGVSPTGHRLQVEASALNQQIVLENDVVVGSVNANLGHYRLAADALAAADLGWLNRLVTRRVPLERFAEAFVPQDDDVKVVITLGEGA